MTEKEKLLATKARRAGFLVGRSYFFFNEEWNLKEQEEDVDNVRD